jgi:hypothetical protein
MGLGFGKWVSTKGGKKVSETISKKVSETITSLKGKYNVGSADKIKKKSNVKKLKSEIEGALGKYIYTSDAEKTAKKLKKQKSWKDYVDTSHPSYKKKWPPGN